VIIVGKSVLNKNVWITIETAREELGWRRPRTGSVSSLMFLACAVSVLPPPVGAGRPGKQSPPLQLCKDEIPPGAGPAGDWLPRGWCGTAAGGVLRYFSLKLCVYR
jgi:hypothetical protein